MARGADPGRVPGAAAGGTERPYAGEYTDTTTEGVYSCRACGSELFRSDTKFESHCGWPSFYSPLAKDSVEYIEDTTLGMKRVEVRCANCGSHLGHVFEGEGYDVPTDQRYCINSISVRLTPAGQLTDPEALTPGVGALCVPDVRRRYDGATLPCGMDKARGPDEARSYRKARGERVEWVSDTCAARGGAASAGGPGCRTDGSVHATGRRARRRRRLGQRPQRRKRRRGQQPRRRR